MGLHALRERGGAGSAIPSSDSAFKTINSKVGGAKAQIFQPLSLFLAGSQERRDPRFVKNREILYLNS